MNDASRSPRAENRARWRALLARYEHSSLSQRDFCLEHDVALSSFVRWRRVFAVESADTGTTPIEPAASGGFVAVRVQSNPASASAPLRITLLNGVRIENICPASVPLVAALIRAL